MAKRIVILGAGESGAGAAVLAKKQGFDTFVSDMSAIKDNYQDGAVMAVNSDNDLIITSDFINDYNKVLSAYKNKIIDEKTIDKAVTRIIAWKYSYKIM